MQLQARPNDSQPSAIDSQSVEAAPGDTDRAIADEACDRVGSEEAEDPDVKQMEDLSNLLWAASYVNSDDETGSSSPSPLSQAEDASGSKGPSVPTLRRMMEHVQAKAACGGPDDDDESSDDSSGVWVPGRDL